MPEKSAANKEPLLPKSHEEAQKKNASQEANPFAASAPAPAPPPAEPPKPAAASSDSGAAVSSMPNSFHDLEITPNAQQNSYTMSAFGAIAVMREQPRMIARL